MSNLTHPSKSRKLVSEMVLAAMCLALALLTLAWPEWIEEVFGLDLDHGSGLLEWMVVVGLGAVGMATAALARIEWRRLREP